MDLKCLFLIVTLSSPHHQQLEQSRHHRLLVGDQCDTCSDCSGPSDLHGNICHTCNTSQIETGSICHCSEIQDQPCYHHHSESSHHHNYSNTHSEGSSWKENLKSSSTLSSSCSAHSHHCKQIHPTTKPKAINNNNKKSAVLPTSTTMKSLAATSNTSSKYNNNKQKSRCCSFCRSRSHSRLTVFFFFFICILGVIAAFFCWPRTPRIAMGGGADAINGPPDWWAGERQPLPPPDTPIPSRPSLRATWQINVTLDNRDNWIPIHLTRLDFVIVDSLTLSKFAWASTSSALVLAPGIISPLSLTFNVNYQAPDRTDPTFQNLYNACGPLTDSKSKRPALNVLFKVSRYYNLFVQDHSFHWCI